MRGRLGPILTTGVVLSAAAAVVANPVIAPRGDLRVPAIELSAGYGDDLAMLDHEFVNAIAPTSTELSSNPLSVLNDLVTSLVADVSYLGRTALIAIFSSGVAAVVDTDLTAVTSPYPTATDNVLAAAPWGPVTAPAPAGLPDLTPALGPARMDPLLAAVVPSPIVDAIEQSLRAVVDDTALVGGRAWTAAVTVVDALLQAGDRVVVDSLRRLVDPSGWSLIARLLAEVPPVPPAPATRSDDPVSRRLTDAMSLPVGRTGPEPVVVPSSTGIPNTAVSNTAVPNKTLLNNTVPLRVKSLPAPAVDSPVPVGERPQRRQGSAAVADSHHGMVHGARDALRRATSEAFGADRD